MTTAGDVIDLFAGAGGWDVAARWLGIDPLGIELDEAACATRAAAGLRTIRDDVTNTALPEDVELRGLIASPPCQTFSMAGKGGGRRALEDVLLAVDLVARGLPVCEFDDARTALVVQPLRYALLHEPEWVAFEQVPPVLPVWEACADVLRAEGYNVWTGNLHAEQYGVPQTRKRAVLLASRTRQVSMPAPTHSRYYPHRPDKFDPGVAKWVSMAEALGLGMTGRPSMTVTGGGTGSGGAEPFCNAARQGMERERQAGRWVVSTGVNSATIAPSAERDRLMAEGKWRECHKLQERSVNAPAPTVDTKAPGAWRVHRPGERYSEPVPAVVGDTSADVAWAYGRPSPTIVGSFAPDVVAAPGYRKAGDGPQQNAKGSVRVTVAEAGVLQSFPADYPWQGSKTKQYQQVGNAIPPLLAAHILEAVA